MLSNPVLSPRLALSPDLFPEFPESTKHEVGTQTISPFYWAIESGSLNSAKAGSGAV